MPASDVLLTLLVATIASPASDRAPRSLGADAITQPAGGALMLACDAGSKDPACSPNRGHVYVKTVRHPRRHHRPAHSGHLPGVKVENPKEV